MGPTLLQLLRRVGLRGDDEARAHPRAVCAQREQSGDAAAVDDASRANDEGIRALAQVDGLRDEDKRADRAGVATTLASLRADDVDPRSEAALDLCRQRLL